MSTFYRSKVPSAVLDDLAEQLAGAASKRIGGFA